MQDNPRLGIALMIATTVVFAVQMAFHYISPKRRYPASGQQRSIAITDWAWLVTCGADMRCDLEF